MAAHPPTKAHDGTQDGDTTAQAVLGTIMRRRSARSGFSNRAIGRTVIEQIVDAGLAAPSSKTARPWRLHVVTDRLLLGEIAEDARTADGADQYVPMDPLTGEPWPNWPSSVAESADVLAAAAAAVFVENRGTFSRGRTVLVNAIRDRRVGSLVAYTFEVVGVGAAIENMWVAATALGVDASFMGDVVVAEDAIRSRLQLEGDLVGTLALGYCDQPSIEAPSCRDGSLVVWHDKP